MSNKKKNRKRQQEPIRRDKAKNTKLMIAGALVAIVIVAISVVAVSAGGGGSNNDQGNVLSDGIQRTGPVSPTWVTAETAGDQVSISKSQMETAGMAHFKIPINGEDLAFMSYELGGEINVRANVCPPCRSIGFSLDGDVLVCNSCGTRFEAATGAGISGACKAFPKASVAYEITGDDIVMQTTDLVVAYENTTEAGWP